MSERYETENEAREACEKFMKETGDIYFVNHEPSWVCKKWVVHEAPKVGEFVSYAFNGDYYPDSKIVRVSKTMKVVTTESGKKYYRKGESAAWVLHGTWSMLKGYHDRLNPHF
jgi:hypothetical protein